mmetsp:Transcript_36418/g.82578  ORF Transcript_36418/g.82578 Transcript_36418/m.82578 type:complete len:652 (+) Transcript_36418:95-2050(+)
MSRAGSPKRGTGAGGGIVVKNTFIDVFNGDESDSDGETGCASPHRRNNSAPPSPTRRKSPVWDLKDDGGSEQEEEDHEGFPTGRFLGTENYLQTAGDNLQKWVELEVNHAKAWDDAPANPNSPQAIRPRKQQAEAWAGMDTGGIDMTNPNHLMGYFSRNRGTLLQDPLGLGGQPSLDLDLGPPEGDGICAPAGMGFSLSGGLGVHPLGLGVDSGTRRGANDGLGGVALGTGLPDLGMMRLQAAQRQPDMQGACPQLGRYDFDAWGMPPDQAAMFAPDPYGQPCFGHAMGPCDGSYPCCPQPGPIGDACLGAASQAHARHDASRREAPKGRGRRQDGGKPGRNDGHHEVPAYVHGLGDGYPPPVAAHHSLLSFPPPSPPQGSMFGGALGMQALGGKGADRGPPPPARMPTFPLGCGGDDLGLPNSDGREADRQQQKGRGGRNAGSSSNKSNASKNSSGGAWTKPGAVAALTAAMALEEEEEENANAGGAKGDSDAAKARQAPLGGGGGPKRTNYLSKYGPASAAEASGTTTTEQQITTMMLKNIPCRKSQEEVMMHVDQNGYSGRYDFFYLPRDVKFRANLGYAFINFITQEDALRFQAEMNGYRFVGSGSSKACSVVPAHVQGLMNNLAAFKRTEVMRSNRKPFFSGVVAL